MLSALKPANRPGLAVQGEARRRPSRIDFVSRSSGDRKTEALQATPRERQLSRVVGTLLSLRLRSNSFERRSTSLRTSQVRLASRTLSKGVRHFSDSRGAFNALPADDWASKTARPFFFFAPAPGSPSARTPPCGQPKAVRLTLRQLVLWNAVRAHLFAPRRTVDPRMCAGRRSF